MSRISREKILKEGTLKHRQSMLPRWKQRHVVFQASGAGRMQFIVYKEAPFVSANELKEVPLDEFAGLDTVFSVDGEKCCFNLITTSSTDCFAAESADEVGSWTSLLQQYLGKELHISITVPPRQILKAGKAVMRIKNTAFSITSCDVPPKCLGNWQIVHIRKFGGKDNFRFQTGRRCPSGENLYTIRSSECARLSVLFSNLSQHKPIFTDDRIGRRMTMEWKKKIHKPATTSQSSSSLAIETGPTYQNHQLLYPDANGHSSSLLGGGPVYSNLPDGGGGAIPRRHSAFETTTTGSSSGDQPGRGPSPTKSDGLYQNVTKKRPHFKQGPLPVLPEPDTAPDMCYNISPPMALRKKYFPHNGSTPDLTSNGAGGYYNNEEDSSSRDFRDSRFADSLEGSSNDYQFHDPDYPKGYVKFRPGEMTVDVEGVIQRLEVEAERKRSTSSVALQGELVQQHQEQQSLYQNSNMFMKKAASAEPEDMRRHRSANVSNTSASSPTQQQHQHRYHREDRIYTNVDQAREGMQGVGGGGGGGGGKSRKANVEIRPGSIQLLQNARKDSAPSLLNPPSSLAHISQGRNSNRARTGAVSLSTPTSPQKRYPPLSSSSRRAVWDSSFEESTNNNNMWELPRVIPSPQSLRAASQQSLPPHDTAVVAASDQSSSNNNRSRESLEASYYNVANGVTPSPLHVNYSRCKSAEPYRSHSAEPFSRPKEDGSSSSGLGELGISNSAEELDSLRDNPLSCKSPGSSSLEDVAEREEEEEEEELEVVGREEEEGQEQEVGNSSDLEETGLENRKKPSVNRVWYDRLEIISPGPGSPPSLEKIAWEEKPKPPGIYDSLAPAPNNKLRTVSPPPTERNNYDSLEPIPITKTPSPELTTMVLSPTKPRPGDVVGQQPLAKQSVQYNRKVAFLGYGHMYEDVPGGLDEGFDECDRRSTSSSPDYYPADWLQDHSRPSSSRLPNRASKLGHSRRKQLPLQVEEQPEPPVELASDNQPNRKQDSPRKPLVPPRGKAATPGESSGVLNTEQGDTSDDDRRQSTLSVESSASSCEAERTPNSEGSSSSKGSRLHRWNSASQRDTHENVVLRKVTPEQERKSGEEYEESYEDMKPAEDEDSENIFGTFVFANSLAAVAVSSNGGVHGNERRANSTKEVLSSSYTPPPPRHASSTKSRTPDQPLPPVPPSSSSSSSTSTSSSSSVPYKPSLKPHFSVPLPEANIEFQRPPLPPKPKILDHRSHYVDLSFMQQEMTGGANRDRNGFESPTPMPPSFSIVGGGGGGQSGHSRGNNRKEPRRQSGGTKKGSNNGGIIYAAINHTSTQQLEEWKREREDERAQEIEMIREHKRAESIRNQKY